MYVSLHRRMSNDIKDHHHERVIYFSKHSGASLGSRRVETIPNTTTTTAFQFPSLIWYGRWGCLWKSRRACLLIPTTTSLSIIFLLDVQSYTTFCITLFTENAKGVRHLSIDVSISTRATTNRRPTSLYITHAVMMINCVHSASAHTSSQPISNARSNRFG